jgi:hypothetical protein
MEVLSTFQYCILWLLKRHLVPLHHAFRVYHDMYDYMDGVMRALAMKKTEWKEDLFLCWEISLTEAFQILC